jgi:hypothetical protein
LGGINFAAIHPNKLDAVVIAAGDLWVVNHREKTAVELLPGIDIILEVQNPEGWILSRQGLTFARIGSTGIIWHTRRISWDGFNQLQIVGEELRGLAWSPVDDAWCPFKVHLSTGMSVGGSYFSTG